MRAMSRPTLLRVCLVPALAATLAGCAELVSTSTVTTQRAQPAATPSAAEATVRVYTCPDGLRFGVRAGPNKARLDFGTRTLVLPRAQSASGARYADGETAFWSKGREARLVLEARIRSGCRGVAAADAWEAAALRGVDFRALGQEPGWQVEVVRGQWLRFVGDYGERKLLVRDPVRVEAADGSVVHRGRAGDRRVRLRVIEQRCTDPMNGQRFALTAVISVDGREYRGCGRRLGRPG